jgi:hypothetical protein
MITIDHKMLKKKLKTQCIEIIYVTLPRKIMDLSKGENIMKYINFIKSNACSTIFFQCLICTKTSDLKTLTNWKLICIQ